MPNKISPQTKSFIVLVVVIVVGTFLCVAIGLDVINQNSPYQEINYPAHGVFDAQQVLQAQPTPTPVDTSTWKTYTDTKYNFSFKYNPAWKVLPGSIQKGFYVVQVDPGAKYYNIKIYVSSTGFYYMGGLPTIQKTLPSGAVAQDVSDLLYGIHNGTYYYTFDIGLSLSLKPNFDALVNSASFNN